MSARDLWPNAAHRAARRAHVRQFDLSDCGPACLLAVLRHYGGDASLAEVRALAHADVYGAALLDLADAADALGFDAVGAVGEYEELRAATLPCVAHLTLPSGQGHYVVVYEVGRDFVVVGDPAARVTTVPAPAFCDAWRERVVLLLTPRAEIRRDVQPPVSAWLREQLTGSGVLLTQAVVTGVIYTILGFSVAFGIQQIIDVLIPGRRTGAVLTAIGFLLAVQVIRATVGFIRTQFLVTASTRTGAGLAGRFFDRIVAMPPSFYDGKTRGDFAVRLQDTQQIQGTVARLFGNTLTDSCIIVGAFAYIAVFEMNLALLMLCATVLLGLWFARAMRRMETLQQQLSAGYSRVESSFLDVVIGGHEILAFNAGEHFSRGARTTFGQYQELVLAVSRQQARMLQVAEVAGGAMILAVLAVGAVGVIAGDGRIGVMIATYSMMAQAVPALIRFVEAWLSMQNAALSASRLLDVGAVPALPGVAADAPVPAAATVAELRLEDVAFAWRPEQPLLHPTSMTLRAGELAVLTGLSGSGKSTLASVMSRRLRPTGGRIYFDGRCTGALGDADYRRHVIVAREEVKIFNGTVADNISMGAPHVQREDISAAFTALGLSRFMARLPRGLDTYLGERGHALSAGERQLVGLMRVFLAKPSVLVADECLNALDAEMLHDALGALRRYSRVHVVLLISHHPDVIRAADRVLRLSGGEVSEVSHGDPRPGVATLAEEAAA